MAKKLIRKKISGKKKVVKKKAARKPIAVLGRSITRALAKEEVPPVLLAMGKDCFIFYADIIRNINLDITCEILTQITLDSVECFQVAGKAVGLVFAKKINGKQLQTLCEMMKAAGARKVLAIYPYALSLL